MHFRTRGIPMIGFVLLMLSTALCAGCLERKLKPLNPCLVSGVVATVAVTNIDKVDMLFMVDNSDSMADKQALLRAQFPRLVQIMASGDKNGDGINDFPPAKDMHIGVVTCDMGLPGVAGISNCQGLGQDGLLQHTPAGNVPGLSCQQSYTPFLSFMAGVNQPMQTANDFACVALVGTGGCGFEHQLEAPLKALWPKEDNRVQFLVDPATGMGATGHGGQGENAGFLRNDPVQGLSLIAIILLTDEDDCSSSDTRPFTPPQYLDPNDPLNQEGLNIRCHFNQQALYPIERYINGFKALRPGNENLVIFAAITGVPQELTNLSALKLDLSVQDQRDKFYANILGDPRMQEVVNNGGTPDPSDDRLNHACTLNAAAAASNQGQIGVADPAIRITKVAQGFGENGVVQSICEADYSGALDAIISIIAKQLGAVCLPRPLVRNSSGLVGCNVVWELPKPGSAPASTPTACGGNFPFLLNPPSDQSQTTDLGGQICQVAQLAVVDQGGGVQMPVATMTNGQTFMEGWYYDDFSDDVKKGCTGVTKQRVSFTPMAKPPTGVTVKLECLNEAQSLANSRTDIMPGIQQPSVGFGCQKAMLNGQTLSGDDACAIKLSRPSAMWKDGIDRSMFCHPKLNVCVLACNTDADCPAAWVCDGRTETLQGTARPGHMNGSKICVNPTCGDLR